LKNFFLIALGLAILVTTPVYAFLGAVNNDLVYTPIAPCRIIDTRASAAGPLLANTSRNFIAINAVNFAPQGGNNSDCGTAGLDATVVAINVTAVFPSATGFATVHAFGTTRPGIASVNYTANGLVNNALIVQIPNPFAAADFVLYTSATSHYVVDIVGYFNPPVATALQCQETVQNTTSGIVPGGTATAIAPICAVGYTQTATNCESTSWLVPFVTMRNGFCSAKNNDTVNNDIKASRTCCRIPGR
jgi:hypothetical protein